MNPQQSSSKYNEQDSAAIFHPALVRKLLLVGSQEETPKMRLSNEASHMAGELLKSFVREAHERASIEAECEQESSLELRSTDNIEIQAHHVAKIAAELLMDFS